MQVSIYEAKTHLSRLIQAAERGEEVVVVRRDTPVARIVAISRPKLSRIGGLSGRAFRMGDDFDHYADGIVFGDLLCVSKNSPQCV